VSIKPKKTNKLRAGGKEKEFAGWRIRETREKTQTEPTRAKVSFTDLHAKKGQEFATKRGE